MIPITGETDCKVLNYNFWRVQCNVVIIALVYAVKHFFESVEFKLHSSSNLIQVEHFDQKF